MYVYLSGNHFQQIKVIIPNNDNVINIYCTYKLEPSFQIRTGASQITKNGDTSKYDYKGYGICFDEGGHFGHTIREGGFGHTTGLGTGFVQVIHDTTIYAEKNFYRNFTDPGKKFVLGLHYNGDDSYLFVNGRQELKFKAKTDQLVKEK